LSPSISDKKINLSNKKQEPPTTTMLNSHPIDLHRDISLSLFSMFQTPDRNTSFHFTTAPSNSFESADDEEKRNASILTVNFSTEPSATNSYATTKSLQRPYTPSNPIPCPNAGLYMEEKMEKECLAEMYDRSTWNMYNR